MMIVTPVDDDCGNAVHAAVQKPGDPSIKRDNSWERRTSTSRSRNVKGER
jgi:hypothetical protein